MVYWMEQHGKQYGYRLWDYDDPEVTWSLPEVTQWYLTANEIQPVSVIRSGAGASAHTY
jgi:hypothetical protein